MRPRIGITCARGPDSDEHLILSSRYVEAIQSAGGLPLLLPGVEGVDPNGWLDVVDGLLLSGGGDVDPVYFGEEPLVENGWIDPDADAVELPLCRLFLQRGKPILGICRGAQVLNIAAGGDIYQDVFSQAHTRLQHAQRAPRKSATHRVRIASGTRLAGIVKAGELRVNSFHHQAIRRVAPGFRAAATAVDGLVEAVEHAGDRFALGVQWHPEHRYERSAPDRALFSAFVAAAGEAARR